MSNAGAELGIAVVGAGRIGTLRARLAAKHPSVRFLAVSDIDPARAEALAETTTADVHSHNNDDVISHPEVNAVIVSTPEAEHSAPVCRALELGNLYCARSSWPETRAGGRNFKRVATDRRQPEGRYSRRYKECFLRAKEQMVHGRLGKVVGGMARYITHAPRHSRSSNATRTRRPSTTCSLITSI
jgi:predicted dehydrogenase